MYRMKRGIYYRHMNFQIIGQLASAALILLSGPVVIVLLALKQGTGIVKCKLLMFCDLWGLNSS